MSEPCPSAPAVPEVVSEISASATEVLRVVVRDEPTRSWVTPVGELDLATAPDFEARLAGVQARCGHVVLDLRALGFLDAAGLRALTAARRRSTRSRGVLEVIVAPGQPRRMLALSRVDGILKIVEPVAPAPPHDLTEATA